MSEPAVRMVDVGKAYKVFPSRLGILLDAVGLERLTDYREFWAVRGFDLELYPGERIGLIGRNGAGKSTLLKLVTQNVQPTEGEVEVNGEVHALFEAAGGLHPEFTGSENIRGALEALGFDGEAITATEREIGEFTELGRFLAQPLKTYSLGMQSRLSFAIATAVRPEILIVDEVLGAGDAYFFGKAVARMQGLVESGAAVLIVSHALDQIVRFCEETIWLDRGRVIMRGPSTEVVKAYEKFIRDLDDRRLRAKNQKLLMPGFDAFERESYTDRVDVQLRTGERPGTRLEVARAALLRDGDVEEELLVGAAQDADESSASFVAPGGDWSGPRQEEGTFFRALEPAAAAASGGITFALWFFYPRSDYELELTYRLVGESATVAVGRNGELQAPVSLDPQPAWATRRIALGAAPDERHAPDRALEVSRWRGSEGPRIADVRLVGADGREQTVFQLQAPLSIAVEVAAATAGEFTFVPAALVFRLDGVVVMRHVGEPTTVRLGEGERVEATLEIDELLLGNGSYLLSLGLYKRLDVNDPLSSEIYDYLDKSFEFMVTGSPPVHNEVYRQPGRWTVAATAARAEAGGAQR